MHNESVTSTEGRPSASGAATRGDAVRGHIIARIVTIVVALFWGVLFFGVIDLITVPIQDETFYQHYLIETGWGLLYTLLVMVPLILWAVRPQWRVFPQQVFVVAAAVLLTGLLTPAPRQVLVALLLALSVVPSVVASRALWPVRGLSVRGVDRTLLVLVALAAVGAVTYAVQMIAAARAGKPDDDTWGLMHLPMQAGFGLALAGTAATTVLAAGAHAVGWRLSTLPTAVCAVWFGVVSILYPDHLGSVGEPAGVAVIVWGVVWSAVALSRSP